MTAKEYLSQAFRLDSRIQLKMEQIEYLRNLSTKATSTIDAIRVSGTRERYRMENAADRIMDYQSEVKEDLERLLRLKREIKQKINLVIPIDQRMILESRYLCFKSWDTISDDLGYSYRQLHRIHGRALSEFGKLIELDQ